MIYVYDGKVVAKNKSSTVYPTDTKVKLKAGEFYTYYVDRYEVDLASDTAACYLRTWRE